MKANHLDHGSIVSSEVIVVFVIVLLLSLYIGAGIVASHRFQHRPWPAYRYICWVFGILCAVAALVGPIAQRAHTDFTAHMLGHLLLGMLAPLLLVLAAPITLAFRTLPVNAARRLSRLLKCSWIRFVTDPIVASLLNVGGLWVLYTTDLYMMMHHNLFLHVLVHVHVFLAGYVFTASMIYIDPTPHRTSFVYRSVVYVIALAGHEILSKYIYAYPPTGVPVSQAEMGGMMMYYGGDVIDLFLIFIMFYQWYKTRRSSVTLPLGRLNKS